jgi:hypothetical protein
MRIRDEDFNVTMLTLEDFDDDPLDEPNHGQPLTLDEKENNRTALMCIELAKLCICIGHVLSSQYTTLSSQPDVPHTTMIVPRRDRQHIRELERCDKEINEWLQALGPNVGKSDSSTVQDGFRSCSEVHLAMLNMAHLTLLTVLHRTPALQPFSDSAEAQAVQRVSRSKLKDAARNLTKLAHTMLKRDQVRFLGLNGVTALIAACLSHMPDIRSSDDDVRDASIFRFYQSMQVLQSLRGTYASADAAVSFLASVIRKTGISVPAQVAMPAPDSMSASANGFARLPTAGNGNSDCRDSAASQDRRRAIVNGHSESVRKTFKVNSLSQNSPQPTKNHPQPNSLLDPDRQTWPASSVIDSDSMTAMMDPSTEHISTSTYASTFDYGTINTEDVRMREENMFHYEHAPSANLSNFTVYCPLEDFSEWNNNHDYAMDHEPIAFNYDFVSDAFGFLDG